MDCDFDVYRVFPEKDGWGEYHEQTDWGLPIGPATNSAKNQAKWNPGVEFKVWGPDGWWTGFLFSNGELHRTVTPYPPKGSYLEER